MKYGYKQLTTILCLVLQVKSLRVYYQLLGENLKQVTLLRPIPLSANALLRPLMPASSGTLDASSSIATNRHYLGSREGVLKQYYVP